MNKYPQQMDQAKAAILKLLKQQPYATQGISGSNLKNICPNFMFLRDAVRNQLIQAMSDDGLIYLRKDNPPRDQYTKCTIFVATKKPLAAAAIKPKVAENKEMSVKEITPEAMRKHAEDLLKAADEAEKRANASDKFKKTLEPVRLDIMQAFGSVQRKFDEFIDAMSVMESAIKKFKEMNV